MKVFLELRTIDVMDLTGKHPNDYRVIEADPADIDWNDHTYHGEEIVTIEADDITITIDWED